jgi:hypothetical protein
MATITTLADQIQRRIAALEKMEELPVTPPSLVRDAARHALELTVRAGVLDATWIDVRKASRFEGPLHAARK